MDQKAITLKNLYRLLTINDYLLFSHGVLRTERRRKKDNNNTAERPGAPPRFFRLAGSVFRCRPHLRRQGFHAIVYGKLMGRNAS